MIGVDSEWQPIDKDYQDNPEIRLTEVPDGTVRFFVGLVDLTVKGFDHGGGLVDNDVSGIIARGTAEGNYNGPDPPFPNMKHNYEIIVKAYDEKGAVIGIEKKGKTFLRGSGE